MGKSNKFSLTTKSHSSTRVNPYDKITSNALNITCPDKQIILPKLKSNGAQHVFIELYSFFIFIIALGTQYLNLYRSVWWLSKSRAIQPINFHLIDLDVSQFSIIFIGQTSLITLLKALVSKATVPKTLNLSTINQSSTNSPSSSSSSSDSHHNNISNNNKENHNSNNHNHHNHLHHNHHNNTKHTLNSPQEDQNIFATIVTATASWICIYYLFKCAYRIWHNFGLNGLASISCPIVSRANPGLLLFISYRFVIFTNLPRNYMQIHNI